MKPIALGAIFASVVQAQSTVISCANYASTIVFTEYTTHYSTCGCFGNHTWEPQTVSQVPTSTAVIILPDATITPSSLNTAKTLTSSNVAASTRSSLPDIPTTVSTSHGILPTADSNGSITNSLGTLTQYSTPSSAFVSPQSSTTDSTSQSLTSAISSITSTLIVSSSTAASTQPSLSTSATGMDPIVTDQAYINTILRHHNIHRLNHTAVALSWSSALAETARKIASVCSYGHNTTVDGGGYGQNIGAGYLSTEMGLFVTEGLYNGEVNNYIYYGGEPDFNTLNGWGHFSQIVWKNTASVGCFTRNCTSTGLDNVGPGVLPYFTVCNYGPPGNFVGQFNDNVSPGVGYPTIHQNYLCTTNENCV